MTRVIINPPKHCQASRRANWPNKSRARSANFASIGLSAGGSYYLTKMGREKLDANVIDAAARGASEGLSLAFNVAAMLLAFIALIAMLTAIGQRRLDAKGDAS